jgi:hypothetical protein
MAEPTDAADLRGRLRLVLGEEDAAAAVEIVVAAGWRPAPPDELVTDEDMELAMETMGDPDLWNPDSAREALKSYGRRLLARHGRGSGG